MSAKHQLARRRRPPARSVAARGGQARAGGRSTPVSRRRRRAPRFGLATLLKRGRARLGAWLGRQAWWKKCLVVALATLVTLNTAVAFFGHSLVSPLSPFFLREKLHALGRYALHRPACLWFGHPALAPLIATAERRHRLPRGLLAAVIEVESGARVHKISAAGAMGPGQLMPDTARLLGVGDPFDPEEAIDASARYLALQLHAFRALPLAIAAYNAGPGAVSGAVPRNGETEIYVRRVLRAYRQR